MDDIFELSEPLKPKEFALIARSRNDHGVQALVKFLSRQIKTLAQALVGANPNDVGAIAQLQAQIRCYETVRQLLTADPTKYEEKKDARQTDRVS